MTSNSAFLQISASIRPTTLDKIVVDGVEYRLHSETDGGFALVETTEVGRVVVYLKKEVKRMMTSRQMIVAEDFYAVPSAARRAKIPILR
ncbi:MAG: hypothetical protein KGI75_29645 [Rhizobiaceae bacterium]|nr:hypothetical protein [Rhizobiaceae bacterium]